MPRPEKILCVPVDMTPGLTFVAPSIARVVPLDLASLAPLFAAAVWRVRDEVEGDPRYRQLIPYVVFRHDPPGAIEPLYFAYARPSKGDGEARLAGMLSIGVGGHVEESDRAPGRSTYDAYLAGLRREVAEEVDLTRSIAGRIATPVACLIDDSEPVGLVHLGLLHVVDLSTAWARERGPLRPDSACGFVGHSLVRGPLRARFENWSRMAIDYLQPE